MQKASRIMIVANTILQFAVLFVGGMSESVQQIVKSADSLAIFRGTRAFDAHTHGIRVYRRNSGRHKNHLRIVQAISILEARDRLKVHVAVCGSHDGEIRETALRDVQTAAAELGVGEQITSVGYVPDGAMLALYRGAEALVMPTFFGPTNIPVLEAWAAGCPVIGSDIRGIREHASDAALLVEPPALKRSPHTSCAGHNPATPPRSSSHG